MCIWIERMREIKKERMRMIEEGEKGEEKVWIIESIFGKCRFYSL